MTTTVKIHGSVKPGFERVREAFEENFLNHGEVGAALAVSLDGEIVVDLWGGYADPQRTRPWERDTLVNVYSTTKGITATCAHRLVDQGLLDLDAPVARYWPEFAQGGKEDIPVRHLLSHRAGLPAVKDLIPLERSFEWSALTDALAVQEPWWTPGEKHGYHALTFGHLVGEVIRRVSGKTVGQYFRDEIGRPLGLDFHLGLEDSMHGRCAEMIPAPLDEVDASLPVTQAMMDPTSLTFKAFFVSPLPMVQPLYMNSPEWRRAEFPAANGHSDARSLATLYGALARGGETRDGFRVLSKESIARATEEHSYGEDAVIMMPIRFGAGFILDMPEMQISPTGALFGHAGMGGSFGYADPDAGIGIGYVMNRMKVVGNSIDPRWPGMISAVYEAL